MTKYRQLALTAVLAVIASSTPALADDWNNRDRTYNGSQERYSDNDRGWSGHYNGDEDRNGNWGWGDRDNDRWSNRATISDRDRSYIGQILRSNFFRDCSRTKRNVCTMPRNPRSDYVIGKRLPRGTEYRKIPSTWRVNAPRGSYNYYKVGNDVVLINEDSGRVVDAVTLRWALRND